MTQHRRRLPHVYPEDTPLFVTFRLQGSVTSQLLSPPGILTSGQAFVWLDRQLDSGRRGPVYLKQPEIAGIVVAAIQRGEDIGHYGLHAYASRLIMCIC